MSGVTDILSVSSIEDMSFLTDISYNVLYEGHYTTYLRTVRRSYSFEA
jgi:hypothetical protein